MSVKIPEILLPDGVDMSAWAVIACDQFTSEKKYWDELEGFVGTKPSTLKMVLPEVYLKDDFEGRISNINNTMQKYLDSGIFKNPFKGFILVERSTPYTKRRLGLVLSVDLEDYSYAAGVKPVIRATEATIVDRLPPRVKIREKAEIEFPHIMLLADDAEKTIIEPLYQKRHTLKKLYDFDLNMGGGHITGYAVEDCSEVLNSINRLADPKKMREKYGTEDIFLFAVGDGNHSLASAKLHWENIKAGLTPSQKQSHPARFALTELVNLYDEGLKFEPIHRYVEGVDADKFLSGYKALVCGGNHEGGYSVGGKYERVGFLQGAADTVKKTDEYISEYIAKNGGSVDYVHGEDSIKQLTSENQSSVGLLMPYMQKEELFASVVKNGSLPKKTFSMGEAVEKRYYIEGKKIV